MPGLKRKTSFSAASAGAKPGKLQRTVTLSNSSLNARIRKISKSVSETKTAEFVSLADTMNTATTPGTAWLIMPYPNLQVGSDSDSRDGNSVNLQKIRTNIVYHNQGTTLGSKVYVRELLLRVDAGRFQTDAQVVANIFEGTVDTAILGDLTDMVKTINQEGIKVMHDKVFQLSDDQATGTLGANASHSIVRKMNDKLLTYRDSGSADPVNDRYLLLTFLATADGASDTIVQVTTMNRMWYKDP